MKSGPITNKQGGAITIFIAVTMLLLTTTMVMTVYSLSTVNIRAVSNVQAREEAIAAVKMEIEKVVGSPFTANPSGAAKLAFPVNIDNDLDDTDQPVNDYFVDIDEPLCERATSADSLASSSVQLPGFSPGSAYNTVWKIRGTAFDTVHGTRVTVTHRVRVLLSEIDKNAVCPT
jgi:hypothetical protein